MIKKKVGIVLVCWVCLIGRAFIVDAPAVFAQAIQDFSTEFDGDTGPWGQGDSAVFDVDVRPGWLQVSASVSSFGSLDLNDTISGIVGAPINLFPPPWHLEMSLERPTDVVTAIGFLAQADGIQYLFNNFTESTGADGRMSFGWGVLFPGFNNKGAFALPNFAGVPEDQMDGPALEIWIGVVDNKTMRYGIRKTGTKEWHFAPDVVGFFDLDADPVSFETFKIMIENRQPWFDQWGGTLAPESEVIVDFDYIRFFVDADLPDPPEITDVTTAPGQATIEWDVPDDVPGVSVVGYNVYRSQPTPFARLNTEPVTELEFVTGDLLEGREYCFVVRSIGDNGFESIGSEPGCDFTPGGEIAGLSTEFDGEMGSWVVADSGETSLEANFGLLELRTPSGTLGSITIPGGLRVNQFPPPWHFEFSLLRDTTTPTAIGVSMESDGIQYLFNNFPGGTGPNGAAAFGAGAASDASGKGVFGLPDFSNVSEFDLGGPAIEIWVGAIDNTTMRYGVRQAGSAAFRFAPDVTGFDLTVNPVSFQTAKIVIENRQAWYDQWPGTQVGNTDAVVELEYIRFFPETPAPNPPQFVSASASDTGVTLNWTAPPPVPGAGIIGFNVYQTEPETELLTFAPTGNPPFVAPTFEEGVEHCYYVRTVGDNGLESRDSNSACATTPIFGDIESLSTEFDGDSGPWTQSDSGTASLNAREGWLRLSTPPNTFGTIDISGGLPVDVYEPEWHFEIRIERPNDVNTAIGFLTQSDGIQYLFTNLPGATGPDGAVSFGTAALFPASKKGQFGAPVFSEVPESEMSGEAIEIWIGVVDSQTMRWGVRPAGTEAWSFAPDVIGGFDLAEDPVSFRSIKIMLENRQGFFDQFADTVAPEEIVSVDIDYIRFFEGESAGPNRPQNVSAVAGGSDVTLSWEAPEPVEGVTIAGYDVFRTTQDGNPARVKLNGDLATDTQFLVPGLVGQREYCFVIRAVGANGFPSDDSEEVCAIPTDEPPPTPAIETGLLSFWELEDGEDCTAFGRDLEVADEVFFEPALVGDGLSIPGGAIFGPGPAYRTADDEIFDFADNDFTIHLWVNFTTLAGEQVLIEKFTGSGGPGWTLTKLATDTLLLFGAGGFGSVTADFPQLEVGAWHHIVARRDDTTVELFVDNEVVGAEFAVSGTIADSPDGLIIGQRNQGDGRGFVVNGVIDEVAIWDRAIANSDITDLYGDGFGAPSLCPDIEKGVGPFIRGDCDGNGQVGGSPTEAIVLLNFSFRGGPAPGCLAACDAEANGSLGITDALRILRHSFLGQGDPDPPFPACTKSEIASDMELGCETPIVCE